MTSDVFDNVVGEGKMLDVDVDGLDSRFCLAVEKDNAKGRITIRSRT